MGHRIGILQLSPHCRSLLVAALLLVAAPAANASATALTWSMPESVDLGHSLNGVSCPSAKLCVAVGNAGRAVTSINPVGGAGTWISADVDGASRLLDISCATIGLCVATDNRAQVVTSTDPTGGAGAWHAARIDPGRWLTGISCPSTKLCVAVDRRGGVISATNPTGGAHAWKRVQAAPVALTGISCPSTRLCVATEKGQKVVAATHPNGGAKAWRELKADPGKDNLLTGVSCPSRKLCVTVDYSQFSSVDELTSRHPTSQRAWRSTFLDDVPHVGNVTSHVACASTSLCVVVDNGDSHAMNAFVSTAPAAEKWSMDTPTLPGSHTSTLNGVSCATGPLCAIADSGGNVIVGT